MKTIKCPKCEHPIEINIAKSSDEEGEVFMCQKCGYKVRFPHK